MSIINIIFVEKLLFYNDKKEALNKMVKRNRIVITYYDDYIVKFDKSNIHSITPHRIVFSKNWYNLLVLYYDEYHEDDDLFLKEGQKCTLLDVKKYIRSYFINNK